MKWIGLSGGIATGKSTASRILRDQGWPVICADELAKQAVLKGTPAFDEVVQKFGAGIVGADGELDRQAIGRRIFADANARAQLEAIVHPRVRAEQRKQRDRLEKGGARLAFYDVPLLFEKSLEDDFDETVVVICDPATQVARLIQRDGFSEDEAKRRIAAQLPLAEKRRRADHVIQNDGSVDDLRASLLALVRRWQD